VQLDSVLYTIQGREGGKILKKKRTNKHFTHKIQPQSSSSCAPVPISVHSQEAGTIKGQVRLWLEGGGTGKKEMFPLNTEKYASKNPGVALNHKSSKEKKEHKKGKNNHYLESRKSRNGYRLEAVKRPPGKVWEHCAVPHFREPNQTGKGLRGCCGGWGNFVSFSGLGSAGKAHVAIRPRHVSKTW